MYQVKQMVQHQLLSSSQQGNATPAKDVWPE